MRRHFFPRVVTVCTSEGLTIFSFVTCSINYTLTSGHLPLSLEVLPDQALPRSDRVSVRRLVISVCIDCTNCLAMQCNAQSSFQATVAHFLVGRHTLELDLHRWLLRFILVPICTDDERHEIHHRDGQQHRVEVI